MSDVLILDLGDSVTGNCKITGYEGKIIVLSYSHNATMPLQGDSGNTERTTGRPILSEMSFSKMADLSTTELYKSCTQAIEFPEAKLYVGRVDNGEYMAFFEYTMTNAMVSSISTSGGGGLPTDSFSLNFSKLQCDFTQQLNDTAPAGTGTWNWNLEIMKSE